MAKKEISDAEFYKQLEEKYHTFFEPDRYKTGIIPLDLALNGYLESGSLIELSGESQTGKSTLLMHLSRCMCEQGEKVVYIDAEGSVKEDQMRGIGLLPYLSTKTNPDNKFTLLKKSSYNEVEGIISLFLKRGGYKLFIIDSITSLIGDVYLDLDSDRNSTEGRVGFDAQQIGRFLKKLNGLKTDHNCIFIFINQTRIDMSNPYITKYESTGGQAVKFYPDVRLFMKLKDKLIEKKALATGNYEVPIGANTTIEARKSRLGLGYIPYPMTVYFGKGISNLNAVVSLLQTIKFKDKVALEKQSTVTYVLHLPSGDYKTSKGQASITPLVAEHFDEAVALVNEYLDSFYEGLRNKDKENADAPADESITVQENKDSDYSLDDTPEETNEQDS